MRTAWKDWEDDLIKKNYRTCSRDYLLDKINRSWNAIQLRAKKHNLYREKGANYANIDFFDSWSADMAYILGFIYADGCIIDRSNSTGDKVLSIAVSKIDYEHLVNIKNRISPNKRIYQYIKNLNGVDRYICYLRIGSAYLCNRLLELGVEHRKTKILKFPNISREYINHFVRGYFDGDGSVGFYGKYRDCRISFASSSLDFLNSLNYKISKNCNVGTKNINYSSSTNYLSYHCNEAKCVSKWMYYNSSLHLERKYKKFLEEKNV